MRKVTLSLVLLLAFTSLAFAQRRPSQKTRTAYSGPQMSRPTGLGMILGEPTGVSFKHWVSNKTAIDAAFEIGRAHV